jgi:glucose/mannose-6-phosphate isomerase
MIADDPVASWVARDSEGMLAATASLPDHIEWALRSPTHLECRPDRLSDVTVLGMGGSGVAGEVLKAQSSRRSSVPVVTAGGYECPAHVGEGSLVFAVSFSGETEETIEAARGALARGAQVVALSIGGRLAELVTSQGGTWIAVQAGIPQPRAGIGAMVAPLLLACEDVGVLEGARHSLERAAAQLRRRMPALAAGGGEAAEVARRIGRTIPIVHGAAGLGSAAARRWKTQVNENAKAPAFSAEEPEVCHNEVCGFGQNGDVTRQVCTLVELHLPGEDPRISERFALVAEAVREAVGDIVSVTGEGDCELSGYFDLVAIGDMTSLHLAAREGIDPGPVPVLTEIKRRLADLSPR